MYGIDVVVLFLNINFFITLLLAIIKIDINI